MYLDGTAAEKMPSHGCHIRIRAGRGYAGCYLAFSRCFARFPSAHMRQCHVIVGSVISWMLQSLTETGSTHGLQCISLLLLLLACGIIWARCICHASQTT